MSVCTDISVEWGFRRSAFHRSSQGQAVSASVQPPDLYDWQRCSGCRDVVGAVRDATDDQVGPTTELDRGINEPAQGQSRQRGSTSTSGSLGIVRDHVVPVHAEGGRGDREDALLVVGHQPFQHDRHREVDHDAGAADDANLMNWRRWRPLRWKLVSPTMVPTLVGGHAGTRLAGPPLAVRAAVRTAVHEGFADEQPPAPQAGQPLASVGLHRVDAPRPPPPTGRVRSSRTSQDDSIELLSAQPRRMVGIYPS